MQRQTTAKPRWRTGPLLPVLPQTTSLDIYDLRGVASEDQLSIASLVGLVNRGPAKIYLLERDDDEFWLKQIDPALPLTRTPIASDGLLDHLLTLYREQVKGLILYDPALPDTRNVATTLAGLRAGLVVLPEQADRLRETPYHLPILADLRTYGWKTGVQAYAWAYEHLLPECSRELVAGLGPSIHSSLRSFLVAQRVFTCWLDARKSLLSLASGWLNERGLFKRVLARFPPGAVHLGWFPSEPFGIRLTSRAALLTLASDHCTNLAVWSSLPANPVAQASTPAPANPLEQPLRAPAGEQGKSNTTYLSFTISDGDNLQYCQHHLLHLWQDPARGKLPLGWTIAPALQQVMPTLAAYYQRTATENDEFIAGPSGVAYVLPSHLPREQRSAFLQLTAEHMQAMQLTLLQVLDSSGWFSMKFLNSDLQKLFAAHDLRGIFSGAGSGAPSWHQRAGLPIYQNLGLAFNPARTLSLIKRAAGRGTRFINVYLFAWSITPGDVQSIVEQLGGSFTVVTPGRLLALIQQEA